MRISIWGVGFVCVAALAALVMNFSGPGSGLVQEGGDARPAVPSRAIERAQFLARPPALPAPVGEASLSRQIQDLVQTGNPAKLYQAYRLLADCIEFNRDHDRMIFDEELLKTSPDNILGYRHMTEQERQRDAKRCGAMTERERQSRLEYLAAAANAGVPGSGVAFLREGPFGDPSALETRPNDPLVQEWKALAKAHLTAEADAGTDLGAVNFIATEYAAGSPTFEQNVRLAYRYFLANGLIHSGLLGPNSDVAKFFAEDSALMDSMGKGLSPAERAAELAAAKQIASNFRQRQARSN